MTETAVRIVGMDKYYGSFHALKSINLEVESGERIIVCGPSGCREEIRSLM